MAEKQNRGSQKPQLSETEGYVSGETHYSLVAAEADR